MPWALDEKWVVAAEEKLGVRLPESYRAKMQAANGGEVTVGGHTWTLHPIRDDSDKKRMKRTWAGVVHETEQGTKWTGWPAGAVAIAANGFGDQLVFQPDAADPARLAPAVWWWHHENGAVVQVAEDFGALR